MKGLDWPLATGHWPLLFLLTGCASMEERRAGWLKESESICAAAYPACAPPNQQICQAYREICKQNHARSAETRFNHQRQMMGMMLMGVSQGLNQQAAIYGQRAQWHHERSGQWSVVSDEQIARDAQARKNERFQRELLQTLEEMQQ